MYYGATAFVSMSCTSCLSIGLQPYKKSIWKCFAWRLLIGYLSYRQSTKETKAFLINNEISTTHGQGRHEIISKRCTVGPCKISISCGNWAHSKEQNVRHNTKPKRHTEGGRLPFRERASLDLSCQDGVFRNLESTSSKIELSSNTGSAIPSLCSFGIAMNSSCQQNGFTKKIKARLKADEVAMMEGSALLILLRGNNVVLSSSVFVKLIACAWQILRQTSYVAVARETIFNLPYESTIHHRVELRPLISGVLRLQVRIVHLKPD
jgi:hypothetical protein